MYTMTLTISYVGLTVITGSGHPVSSYNNVHARTHGHRWGGQTCACNTRDERVPLPADSMMLITEDGEEIVDGDYGALEQLRVTNQRLHGESRNDDGRRAARRE